MSRLAYRFDFVNFGDICTNCHSNCCKRFYAVLLPEEEEVFAEKSFAIETERGVVKCIGANAGKPCPYLDEKGYCTIYKERPLDCRLWPVIVYIDFKTQERVVYLDLECPAVREGRIPASLINRIVEELKKAELDDAWLEKYTLAPWPNNLIEVTRFKQQQEKTIAKTIEKQEAYPH